MQCFPKRALFELVMNDSKASLELKKRKNWFKFFYVEDFWVSIQGSRMWKNCSRSESKQLKGLIIISQSYLAVELIIAFELSQNKVSLFLTVSDRKTIRMHMVRKICIPRKNLKIKKDPIFMTKASFSTYSSFIRRKIDSWFLNKNQFQNKIKFVRLSHEKSRGQSFTILLHLFMSSRTEFPKNLVPKQSESNRGYKFLIIAYYLYSKMLNGSDYEIELLKNRKNWFEVWVSNEVWQGYSFRKLKNNEMRNEISIWSCNYFSTSAP